MVANQICGYDDIMLLFGLFVISATCVEPRPDKIFTLLIFPLDSNDREKLGVENWSQNYFEFVVRRDFLWNIDIRASDQLRICSICVMIRCYWV